MQNSPIMEQKAKARILTLRIIWGALFSSQLIYLYVVKTIAPLQDSAQTLFDTSDPMSLPFAMMSAFSLAASIFIPKLLSRQQASRSINEALNDEKNLDRDQTLFNQFFVPFIIRLALLESITLYGFVLAIIHHDTMRMLVFMVISSIGFILNFPTEEKIRQGFR